MFKLTASLKALEYSTIFYLVHSYSTQTKDWQETAIITSLWLLVYVKELKRRAGGFPSPTVPPPRLTSTACSSLALTQPPQLPGMASEATNHKHSLMYRPVQTTGLEKIRQVPFLHKYMRQPKAEGAEVLSPCQHYLQFAGTWLAVANLVAFMLTSVKLPHWCQLTPEISHAI